MAYLEFLYRLRGFVIPLTLTLCAQMVLNAPAFASVRMPPQVKFRPIVPNELEKIGYINTLIQDPQGYIWIGAMKGLARFNGYDIKIYSSDPEDSNSLSDPWVKSLLVDSRSRLWATTLEGLCQFIPESEGFKCIQYPTQQGYSTQFNVFYTLFEDRDQRFWVSTSNGIQLLDPDTGQFMPAPQAIVDAAPVIENSEDNFVHQITQDQNGILWFGLEGNGLIRYDPATEAIRHYREDPNDPKALPGNKIREVLIDSHNALWVGSIGGGISRFDPNTEEFHRFTHSANEKADTVWDIQEDQNGILWVGDGTGVHLLDPESSDFTGYNYVEGKNGGPGNYVTREIFMDRSGAMWIGYFPSGVDTTDQAAARFLNYRHDPDDPFSLADGGVLSTLEASNGDIWVGSGFGLNYFDRSSGKFSLYVNDPQDPKSISGSTALKMAMEDDGTLWIGAWDRGLNRKEPGSDHFKRYQADINDPRSLLGREPWAVALDKQGQLWVGTEKGVNLYRPETDDFEHIMPVDGNGKPFNSLYVRHILSDTQGYLWLSTFNGLYQLDPVTQQYIQHFINDPEDHSSLSFNQVLTTFEDRSGNLWVGTNGAGLNMLDRATGKFKRYGLQEGLPDLSISGIVDDEFGHIWISTFQGLAELNLETQKFNLFEKSDGLIGNMFNRNSPSRLSSGELVFGSSRGLTIFDPTKLRPNPNKPPVVITQFSIFNQPILPGPDSPLTKAIGQTEHITLTYKQSVFSFEFAGLDYRAPEENQYAYRLLGFEENWNYVGKRRSATYTNLDPGKYTLQVKAANNSGVWNETPKQISITITPPIWRTLAAYVLYLIVFALITFNFFHNHRKKILYERKKYQQERAIVTQMKEIDQMKDEINRELDRKVAERTEELRQEHARLIIAQNEMKLLNQKLENVSVTDQLTGLKNRRFLYQTIDTDIAYINREYANALKQKEPQTNTINDLTFLLIDVDKFKSVNDQFGHHAGDAILTQLSEVLQQCLRESDYLIRWGGEEFIIVVRNLPRARAGVIVERIILAVKQHDFKINSDITLKKTCSIGVASYPFCPTAPLKATWEQVINVADRALYCAKESGRDCWVELQCNASADINRHENLIEDIDGNNLKGRIQSNDLIVSSSKPFAELVWPS